MNGKTNAGMPVSSFMIASSNYPSPPVSITYGNDVRAASEILQDLHLSTRSPLFSWNTA